MVEPAWVSWFIVILPFIGFLLAAMFGRYTWEGGAGFAIGSIAGSLVFSVYVLIQVLSNGAIGGEFSQIIPGYEWIPGVEFNLLIDNLSALLMTLVSFLSLLIVIYSVGYMHEEEGKPRYYAEVSLFVGGMLATVTADNFLQLLIAWEIMGLCSYLLIGFWYKRPEAASAAKKAFLVTRVGDVLFLAGVLAIWVTFGSFAFEDITAKMAALYPTTFTPTLVTAIPLLLFAGAVGKSAQFPLHAWLPDAMEGPATVSALIHAATMVKAGVYLTARSFIFLVPPAPIPAPTIAILVIAVIGGFTAIFAASMAIVNYDIKRVLAFSTISQLAYMFFGLGVGAFSLGTGGGGAGYSAALYHLFNHAFFKALLFLDAGAVIHAVHTNDMRSMGGLQKSMPIAAMTMLFGSLALVGIPPFSGFFSKGEILSATFGVGAGNPAFYAVYAVGLTTAFLTAFYAFRMWFLTFRGEFRGTGHPHDAPRSMGIPLLALGAFTVISGLLAYPLGGFGNFIFFGAPDPGLPLVGLSAVEYGLEAVSVAVAVAGIVLAYAVYETRAIPAARFTATPGRAAVHRMLSRRYYIDDAYNWFGAKVVAGFASAADWFDRNVIDGIVNAVGRGGASAAAASDWFDRKMIDGAVNSISLETVRSALTLRQRQTGRVQSYVFVIILGVVFVILLILGSGALVRLLGR